MWYEWVSKDQKLSWIINIQNGLSSAKLNYRSAWNNCHSLSPPLSWISNMIRRASLSLSSGKSWMSKSINNIISIAQRAPSGYTQSCNLSIHSLFTDESQPPPPTHTTSILSLFLDFLMTSISLQAYRIDRIHRRRESRACQSIRTWRKPSWTCATRRSARRRSTHFACQLLIHTSTRTTRFSNSWR